MARANQMQNASFGGSYMPGSLAGSMRSGIDAKYSKIEDIKEPIYKRDLTKNEAGIQPDKGSTIKIAQKK